MGTALWVSIFCSILLGVIIVFGIIGNILSIIVWSMGSRCSDLSCGYYFRLLAVADIFNLLVSGISFLLDISPANITLYDYNNFFCKFLPFSAHFGVQLSLWITVSATIERTLTLRYPMRFLHVKTKTHAYCAFCLISLIAFILDFMPLWLYEIENVQASDSFSFYHAANDSASLNTTTRICVIKDMYQTYYRVWNVYISFGCFVVSLPTVLIMYCNILTLVTLRRQSNTKFISQNRNNNSTSVSFTYLVIVVGIINCISTIPVGYLYIIQFEKFYAKSYPVLYRVSLLLFFLNSGTNVVFYCFSGKAFRQDLKQLLRYTSTGSPLRCSMEIRRLPVVAN